MYVIFIIFGIILYILFNGIDGFSVGVLDIGHECIEDIECNENGGDCIETYNSDCICYENMCTIDHQKYVLDQLMSCLEPPPIDAPGQAGGQAGGQVGGQAGGQAGSNCDWHALFSDKIGSVFLNGIIDTKDCKTFRFISNLRKTDVIFKNKIDRELFVKYDKNKDENDDIDGYIEYLRQNKIDILKCGYKNILEYDDQEYIESMIDKSSDLSGKNLSKNLDELSSDLSNTNLSDTDLTNTDLTNVDLTGAKLSDANLTGANLTSANLTSANLDGANFTGANLTRANLTNIILRNEINFDPANLTNANLNGTTLTNINFEYGFVILDTTNFEEATINNVIFSTALTNSNLTNVTFTNTNFTYTSDNTSDLEDIDLSKSTFTNVTFENCSLENASFTEASFTNVTFENCSLENTNFEYATFNEVKFINNTNLHQSHFNNAKFNNQNEIIIPAGESSFPFTKEQKQSILIDK